MSILLSHLKQHCPPCCYCHWNKMFRLYTEASRRSKLFNSETVLNYSNKIHVPESLFNKVEEIVSNFIKSDSPRVFRCEFCEIFQKSIFTEQGDYFIEFDQVSRFSV